MSLSRNQVEVIWATFLKLVLVYLVAAIVYFQVLWAERGRIGDGPSWIRCRAAQV